MGGDGGAGGGDGGAGLTSSAARMPKYAPTHSLGCKRTYRATVAGKYRYAFVAASLLPSYTAAPSMSSNTSPSSLTASVNSVTHRVPILQPCVTTPSSTCDAPESIVMNSPAGGSTLPSQQYPLSIFERQ